MSNLTMEWGRFRICLSYFPNIQSFFSGIGEGGVDNDIRGLKDLRKRLRHVSCTNLRLLACVIVLMAVLLLFDSFLLSLIQQFNCSGGFTIRNLKHLNLQNTHNNGNGQVMYKRLFTLASKIESRIASSELWKEPHEEKASRWKPCAANNQKRGSQALLNLEKEHGNRRHSSRYVVVSANGGLNQQRVAVCNAVVVAFVLNASLVLPRFLYSSVWKDVSQFGDIYQVDYFINYLRNDLNIVKELPLNLQVDFEAIGSQITDTDIMKESTPDEIIKTALPLLQRNNVVHFLGFVNRLAFDPMEPNLQRLRCKCNFHALKFVPKIQNLASLLIRRIRNFNNPKLTNIHKQLLGSGKQPKIHHVNTQNSSNPQYIALHLRFEIDMVAYSLCDFGGGITEARELQAYREIHFPRLVKYMKTKKNSISPKGLKKNGKCPLTPEEVALVLSALGFEPSTYIFLAGSSIYGGKSRLGPLSKLFPNMVTKEDLLTPSELAPFKNFSNQLAALDFIACATSDVFSMTDSGSQLSSLVSGYRVYHGRGHAPLLRPNKEVLANILSKSRSIEWTDFVRRIKKMIDEDQNVHRRLNGQSIYRHPRSKGCMCKV